jgi:hypothetical protein
MGRPAAPNKLGPPIGSHSRKSSIDSQVRSATGSEDSGVKGMIGKPLSLASSSSSTTLENSVTNAAALFISSSASSTSVSTSGKRHKSSRSLSNDAIQFPISPPTPKVTSQPLLHNSSRRDSQDIIFRGFLQRKADYAPPVIQKITPLIITSPTTAPISLKDPARTSPITSRSINGAIDLQRGWKPYLVVLRGAKLYLHKLPNELSTTAKALFPVTVIDEGASQGLDFGLRKQRAFWGTGGVNHPGLLVNSEGSSEMVKGGTLEALVHELIFGTTFHTIVTTSAAPVPSTEEDEEATATISIPTHPLISSTPAEGGHDTFLQTLILVWPYLPFSATNSASELDRCSGLAVRSVLSTPEMERRPAAIALAARLERFTRTIYEMYPEDLRMMENGESRNSPIKSTLDEIVHQLRTLSEVAKDEVDIIVAELSAGLEAAVKTDIKVMRPTEFSHSRSNSRQGSSSASSSPSKPRRRASAESDVVSPILTSSAFLASDPIGFADQIHSFHLNRLATLCKPRSLGRHIISASATLLSTVSTQQAPPIATLFSFSASRPHFLSRLVIDTIFTPSPASVSSTLWSPALPATNELRALVIIHWITVAEELRSCGDAAGFIAIAMALCSRAVARLDDTWRKIPTANLQPVREDWTSILAGLGFADEEDVEIRPLTLPCSRAGAQVPYLGTIVEESYRAIKATRTPIENQPGAVDLTLLYSLRHKIQVIEALWSGGLPGSIDTRRDSDLQHLFQQSSRSSTSTRLSSFLPLSLEAEPQLSPLSGSELLFKTRPTNEPSPLLPLLMVEALPYISLVDRSKILHSTIRTLTSKHSTSSLASEAAAIQQAVDSVKDINGRLARRNSHPPSAPPTTVDRTSIFARLREDIANPSDTLLRFSEGDLILRVVSSAMPAIPLSSPRSKDIFARTASWVETRYSRPGSSRRTSVISSAGITGDSKRVSTIGSARNSLLNSPTLQVAGEEEPINVVVKAGTIDTLVDLLIVGIADTVRAPTTDADGEESLNSRRPFQFDTKEYQQTFFSTFRAFASPLTLLEMIRKRYLAAINASQEYPTLSSARPFPTWSSAIVNADADIDWNQVAIIRGSLIGTLRYWVEHHILDFMGDDELFTSASTFISFVELTEKATQESAAERQQNDDNLRNSTLLQQHFHRDSLRPPTPFKRAMKADREEDNLSFDDLTSSDLLDRLDQIAAMVNKDISGALLLHLILECHY